MLFVCQEWSSLPICGYDTSTPKLYAGGVWECNDDGCQEQEGHDGEGKDPLESNHDDEELVNTESAGQNG